MQDLVFSFNFIWFNEGFFEHRKHICNVIHFDKSLFIIQMLTQMQAKVFANLNFYHEMGTQSVIDLLW